MFYNQTKKLRKKELFWRYLFNLKPSLAYAFSGKDLSGPGKRIVNDLKKNGIAFSSVEELQIDKDLFRELTEELSKREEECKEQLENARKTADSFDKIENKTFIVHLLGLFHAYDEKSIFNRIARKSFQAISDAYFDMKGTDIRDYNIWHNVPTQGPPRTSQLWHQDREDLQILKIFIYFTDVDENSGPFIYAPGTQLQGPIKQHPEYHIENGVKRTTNEQMEKIVPKDKWIVGLGKKGTIVFADTHGYHKGGEVKSNDRIMFNVLYTSPACERTYFTQNPK